MAYISPEWVRAMEEYERRHPKPAAPVSPGRQWCPDRVPSRRVVVADFESNYDAPPEAHLRAAVRAFQRGHETAPYCVFEKTIAVLYWRKVGSTCFAYWFCAGCFRRSGSTLPYTAGRWITLP